MHPSLRISTIWFVFGWSTLALNFADALHWVPGMGHFEELLPGVVVAQGVALPDTDVPDNGPHRGVQRPDDEPLRVLSAADCPICRLSAAAKPKAGGAVFYLTLPCVDKVTTLSPLDAHVEAARTWQARAPPYV